MEEKWRWVLVAAVAPIAWGATYYVTRQALPPEAPLWGSMLRALPAGLVLLLVARRLPRGRWWWRSLVLALLNVSAFLVLLYLAAQLLPTSIAASIMALSPVVLAGFAWAIVAERPTARIAIGAALGILGVVAIVGTAVGGVEPWGVAASLGALVLSSAGAVLGKRWQDGTPLIAMTAWQLTIGGLLLVPVAVAVEWLPPAPDLSAVGAYAFSAFIATALAYICWFGAIQKLPVGIVGVIGLLNPVTGVLLGTLFAGEILGWSQAAGIALVLLGIGLASLGPNRPRPGTDSVRSAAPESVDSVSPSR